MAPSPRERSVNAPRTGRAVAEESRSRPIPLMATATATESKALSTNTALAEEWSLPTKPNFACVFGSGGPKHWPLAAHTNFAIIGYAGRQFARVAM